MCRCFLPLESQPGLLLVSHPPEGFNRLSPQRSSARKIQQTLAYRVVENCYMEDKRGDITFCSNNKLLPTGTPKGVSFSVDLDQYYHALHLAWSGPSVHAVPACSVTSICSLRLICNIEKSCEACSTDLAPQCVPLSVMVAGSLDRREINPTPISARK